MRKEQKPVPVLKYKGKKLKNKTDFTLSYASPQTDPQTGETTVTVIGIGSIEGIGSFGGSKTISYKMAAKDINSQTADGKADIICQADYMSKEFFYIGNAVKPKVVLVDNTVIEDGEPKVLTENEDYILKYAGNKNVTTSKPAVITPNIKMGMAASDNEKIKRTFTIKPLDLADAVIKEIPDQKFKGQPAVPTPLVKIGKLTLQERKGDIAFEYIDNSKRGIAKLSIKPGSNGNYTGEKSVVYLIK